VKALAELVAQFVTAPSTSPTTPTLADSACTNTMRSETGAAYAFLMSPWSRTQATGELLIKSPNLIDNGKGIALQHVSAEPTPYLPISAFSLHKLAKNETLTITATGSGTSGDIEQHILPILYPNPASAPQYIGIEELNRRRVGKVITARNSIVCGTSGAWGTAQAINASTDVFSTDYVYAVLGYICNLQVAAVAYSGLQTGNLRWGGPGHATKKELTSAWFVINTRAYGYDLIPTFAGVDAGKFNVNAIGDENATTSIIETLLLPLTKA
jgi:hypothetical protein